MEKTLFEEAKKLLDKIEKRKALLAELKVMRPWFQDDKYKFLCMDSIEISFTKIEYDNFAKPKPGDKGELKIIKLTKENMDLDYFPLGIQGIINDLESQIESLEKSFLAL